MAEDEVVELMPSARTEQMTLPCPDCVASNPDTAMGIVACIICKKSDFMFYLSVNPNKNRGNEMIKVIKPKLEKRK